MSLFIFRRSRAFCCSAPSADELVGFGRTLILKAVSMNFSVSLHSVAWSPRSAPIRVQQDRPNDSSNSSNGNHSNQ